MRIVVFSDTHGRYSAMEEIVERNLNADMFVFLGDGEREFDNITALYPKLDFRHVSGNCDYASFAPDMIIIGAENVRILATHGHRFGVKISNEYLKKLAVENNCKVVLFGHTHERYENYENGIYFLNPGSASCPRDGKKPSYGYIDITPAGIVTNIVTL